MNTDSQLLNLLLCPKCNERLANASPIKCSKCDYKVPCKNNVLIFDSSPSTPKNKFYNNKNWDKYRSNQAKIHDDYYTKNSISSFLEKAFKNTQKKLIKNLTPPILDFGGSSGFDYPLFNDFLNQTVVVDMDYECLQASQKVSKSPLLVCTDINTPSFAPECFKTIFALNVLEHIFNLEKTISSLANLLHPDGYLYVSIPTEGGLASLCRKLYTAPRYSKMFDYDYNDALSIEHCNTCYAVENALNKWFIIDQKTSFPFPFTNSLCNVTWHYRLRKR